MTPEKPKLTPELKKAPEKKVASAWAPELRKDIEKQFAQFEAKFQREALKNPEALRIVDGRKYRELSASDIEKILTLQPEMRSLFALSTKDKKGEFRVQFFDNVSCNTQGVDAEYLIDTSVRAVMVAGKKYVRDDETGQFFIDEKEKDQENPYLALRKGDRVKILSSEKALMEQANKKRQELAKKRVDERREGEMEARLARILQGKSTEKPADIMPLSTQADDLQTFFRILDTVFGKLFWEAPSMAYASLSASEARVKLEQDISTKVTPEKRAEAKDRMYAGQIPFARIRSAGVERDPETGTTLCSRTAQKDAKVNFGLVWPRWNANEVKRRYEMGAGNENPGFIRYEKPLSGVPLTAAAEGDTADIFTKSNTGKGRIYGHRLTAFRHANEWYVLDPYTTGGRTDPMPLHQYERDVCQRMGRPITGIAYYQSSRKVV